MIELKKRLLFVQCKKRDGKVKNIININLFWRNCREISSSNISKFQFISIFSIPTIQLDSTVAKTIQFHNFIYLIYSSTINWTKESCQVRINIYKIFISQANGAHSFCIASYRSQFFKDENVLNDMWFHMHLKSPYPIE